MTRVTNQAVKSDIGRVTAFAAESLPPFERNNFLIPGNFTAQNLQDREQLDAAALKAELADALLRNDQAAIESLAPLSFDLKDYPSAIKAYAHLQNVELTKVEIQMVLQRTYNFTKFHFTVKDQYLSLLSSLMWTDLSELNEYGPMIFNLGDDLLFGKIIDLLLDHQQFGPARTFCWYLTKGSEPEYLRKMAVCAEEAGNRKLAARCFAAVGDQENQKRLILDVLSSQSESYLDWGYDWRKIKEHICFFDPDEMETVNAALKRWTAALGLKISFPLWEYSLVADLNMACECLPRYDIAMAVANAGLTPGLVFKIAGMNVKIMEDHDHFFKFSQHTPVTTAMLRGKKILLLENDVRTGKTLQMVFEALEPFEPAEVGVFLCNHDPGRLGNLPHDHHLFGRLETNQQYGFSKLEDRVKVFKEKIASLRI